LTFGRSRQAKEIPPITFFDFISGAKMPQAQTPPWRKIATRMNFFLSQISGLQKSLEKSSGRQFPQLTV
jgi:hypothetical protein